MHLIIFFLLFTGKLEKLDMKVQNIWSKPFEYLKDSQTNKKLFFTLFYDLTRDSIANNFVTDVYCRCLEILCQIALNSIANYFRSYSLLQFGIKSIGIYSKHQ